jgi:hypothetical protein
MDESEREHKKAAWRAQERLDESLRQPKKILKA